jgi:hypothetical protein
MMAAERPGKRVRLLKAGWRLNPTRAADTSDLLPWPG